MSKQLVLKGVYNASGKEISLSPTTQKNINFVKQNQQEQGKYKVANHTKWE